MLSSYHTLSYLASNLHSSIRGSTIGEVYSQRPGELVLSLAEESRALIVVCRRDISTCFLYPDVARAKRNTVDLLPAARGRVIEAVSIHPSDRVLTFHLKGSALVAQFFGAKSNVLLVDASGTTVDAFKNPRTVSGRTMDETPQTEQLLDVAAFMSNLRGTPAVTVLSALRRSFPTLGATLVAEILHRAGIPQAALAGELQHGEIDLIPGALGAIMTELGDPAPRIYCRADGSPITFSLIPLRSYGEAGERLFDDVHEAIRFFLARRQVSLALDGEKAAVTASLRQTLEKAHRTLDAVSHDARLAERADEYERCGILLMSHLTDMLRGSRGMDIDGEHLPLDPKLTAVQNAQKYFEKAKRSRQTLRESAGRRTSLERRIAVSEQLLETIERAATPEQWRSSMTEHANEFEEIGLGPKEKARKELPFRVFTVDGGFDVWVGKNSTNNDLLTMRYAKPEDLWFHARGASGSHVVLKTRSHPGEPGRKAREQAASIAAYYSKMKNASMVPVAMTLRKYVRKPRGSPPGTVVIEREKVIFAEPALPREEKKT
jgi:predicted ribosome quality control (RQC) complex YloA/Tae2 family protein